MSRYSYKLPIHAASSVPMAGMIAGVLAVSTASIFIRLAQTEAAPQAIALYRLGIATLVLLPFAARHWREAKTLTRGQWALLAAGGFALALHFVSWIASLQFTSVMSSAVFVTTSPLWVAILSPLLLRESVGRGVRLGLGLALVGSMVVALSGAVQIASGQVAWMGLGEEAGSQQWKGNLLALLGAWCAAGFLITGRKLRPVMSLVMYSFLLYGFAAVCMLGLVLITRQPLGGYAPQTYIWLISLAFIPQLMGHSLFNWALRYVSAAYVAVMLLGEPVGASILAMLFLGEVPGWLEIFGALIILSGIYVVTQSESRT